MNENILAARLYSGPREDVDGEPADKLFVQDLVLDARIGVFDEEQGKTQKVRFDVEADMRPSAAHLTDDFAQVLSYDAITDGIKAILHAGHIGLVETLAERIASFCLADHRVLRVRVRVAKLEREPGAVGVEIVRRSAPGPAAAVVRGWPPRAGA